MLPYTAIDMLHAITADLVPEGDPNLDRAPVSRQRRTFTSTFAFQYRRVKGARFAK